MTDHNTGNAAVRLATGGGDHWPSWIEPGVAPRPRPAELDRTIQRPTLSAQQYGALSRAFEFYNAVLFHQHFGTRLPDCLILVSTRCRSAYGYFCGGAFRSRLVDGRTTDELGLNPKTLAGRPDAEVMQTLVHEMVHLKQQHDGRPSRRGYHNGQWANWMEAVGLMPSTTGHPGGHRTGQRVSDFVIPGGPFDRATRELLASGPILHWEAAQPRALLPPGTGARPVSKVRYSCRGCGLNAWAKPRAHLVCGTCAAPMLP